MSITRTSSALASSLRRWERLSSIIPQPDFGAGFSIADFKAKIDALASLEASYNRTRSEVDAQLSTLKKAEMELLDHRERMLTAIAFLYGKDSEEYVAAGGVRKSERKRPRLRTVSPAQTE